jgi:hypothetical protein
MKKLELNQMENLEGGRRFWGTETIPSGICAPNVDGTPGCTQGLYSTYYVLWIATGDPVLTGSQPCAC